MPPMSKRRVTHKSIKIRLTFEDSVVGFRYAPIIHQISTHSEDLDVAQLFVSLGTNFGENNHLPGLPIPMSFVSCREGFAHDKI